MKTIVNRVMSAADAAAVQAIAADLNRGELMELERELDGIAQCAAFRAAYVGRLAAGQGNLIAMTHAVGVLLKVRKALGYTHP